MTNPTADQDTDFTPTMPTRLALGNGNEYEVVTAIYVPPLYGDVLPCWVAVLRVAPAVFVVVTVTSTNAGYRVEWPTDDLPCRRAHKVAWKRAADRYGLAG